MVIFHSYVSLPEGTSGYSGYNMVYNPPQKKKFVNQGVLSYFSDSTGTMMNSSAWNKLMVKSRYNLMEFRGEQGMSVTAWG